MSESISFPIVVSPSNLIKGLGVLAPYEYKGEGRGMYRYLPITSIQEIIQQLPHISEAITAFKDEEEYLLQCTLLKESQFITFTIAALAQHIFPFTKKAHYLFINVEVEGLKKMSIATDDPCLPFLFEVLQAVEPVFGDTDFWTAHPKHYLYGWPFREEAPWQIIDSTALLGKPLSTIVKKQIDLESANNGLYFVKKLGESLYFLTGPEEDTEPTKYQKHHDTLRQVMKILEAVPADILEEVTPP